MTETNSATEVAATPEDLLKGVVPDAGLHDTVDALVEQIRETEMLKWRNAAPPKTLTQRLAAVMGGVSRVRKSGRNQFHGYDFATDGDVSDMIRILLAEQEVEFGCEMSEIVERTQVGKNTFVTCRFVMTLRGADEVRAVQWFSEAMDTGDKALNKCATAGVKYFLLKTFLVSTGDLQADPDAGGEGERHTKPRSTKTTKREPPSRKKKEEPKHPVKDRQMPAGASDPLKEILGGIVIARSVEELTIVGSRAEEVGLSKSEKAAARRWWKDRGDEIRRSGADKKPAAGDDPPPPGDSDGPWNQYIDGPS